MRLSLVLATTALLAVTGGLAAADDLRIALISSKTGPLEAYAKQTETGFNIGLEYATNGTMTSTGARSWSSPRTTRASPTLPSRAGEAYADDKVDSPSGPRRLGAALAMLSVAEETRRS